MLYVLNFLYLFSFSELPLAIYFICALLYSKLYRQIALATFIVVVDCIFKYFHGLDYLYRFWQNLFLVSVLIVIITGASIRVKSINYRLIFRFLVLLALFRCLDMAITGGPNFDYINQNLIGLSLFSIAMISGISLTFLLTLSLLSIKGLLILSLISFRRRFAFYVIPFFAFALLYFLDIGVSNELIGDFNSNNISSGRAEIWGHVFENYELGFDYRRLLEDGFSNTESFFLNQIYSISFLWPLTVAMTFVAVYKTSRFNILRLVVLVIFIFYPYPLIILINKIFIVNRLPSHRNFSA